MGIGEYTLQAETRPQDTKPAVLRNQGKVPGVVYGKEVEPVAVALDSREANKIYRQAGASSLVNLVIGGQAERPVLFREAQTDPRTGELVHLDFYQVNLGEKIKAEVPLVFVGEAPAIEAFDGVLVTNKDKLEVESLPRDLPHEFSIDLSGLANIDDSIAVKDIKVPSGVEILDEMDEIIVVVTPQRAEEEVPEVSEAEAVAGVEVETAKTEGETETAESEKKSEE